MEYKRIYEKINDLKILKSNEQISELGLEYLAELEHITAEVNKLALCVSASVCVNKENCISTLKGQFCDNENCQCPLKETV